VLQECDGYLDRNEFDFFVSRIRTANETVQAAAAIAAYRALSADEQQTLHALVRDRIPGAKAYSNWRDVGLHTFSLFSLGTSMVRDGTRLLLTSNWVNAHAIPPAPAAPMPPQGAVGPQLRMPEPPELEELLAPPATPASNDGADAESFVAKVLRSQGWDVAFYTNRRGYGFDLWARKANRAMVIEVKSSLGVLGEVSLTPTEYQAAYEHAESYVLALVEHTGSDSPRLSMIQNPVAALRIEERKAASYVISRSEWLRAARTE
jgi:Holliday junction resolvase-like predicted endonuclease